MNCNTHKTLQTLEAKLEAARIAAHKFSRGLPGPDADDAKQEAQLAVLEYVRKGREGTFSYWYTVATHRLLDLSRANERRMTRDHTYTVRLYGHDAVSSDVSINEDAHAQEQF